MKAVRRSRNKGWWWKSSGSAGDTLAPTVVNVTATNANGIYGSTDTIGIQVVFSEPVVVTGTPQLTLETGSSDAVVNYVSGSGTDTLLFNYTPAVSHLSEDLDYKATNSLTLNGGTIQDAAANNATLTLFSPGGAGSLGANKAIQINQPPSGYKSRYRASDGLTYDGGGAISSWADIGTNGFNATQSVAAEKPTRTAAGRNGFDIATFDGGDSLDMGATAGIDNTAAWTMVFAGNEQAGGVYPGMLLIKAAANNLVVYENMDVTNNGTDWRLNNPPWGMSFAGPGNNVPFFFVGTYNGSGMSTTANYSVDLTGVSKTLSGYSETAPTNRNVISNSGGTGLIGDMYEIFLYDRAFNATEKTQMNRYMKAKWDLG